jgi:hypothetical protein
MPERLVILASGRLVSANQLIDFGGMGLRERPSVDEVFRTEGAGWIDTSAVRAQAKAVREWFSGGRARGGRSAERGRQRR